MSKAYLIACAFTLISVIGYCQDETKRESESSSAVKQADERAKPRLSEKELIWETLETHLAVNVVISGKKFGWRKRFTKGTQPEFKALRKKLNPGIYSYHVTFIPNEVEEKKSELEMLLEDCTELAKQYEDAVENGKPETVKKLYWQVRELTKLASMMRSEQAGRSKDDYIVRSGKFVVAKGGIVKEYRQMGEDDAELYGENRKRVSRGGF